MPKVITFSGKAECGKTSSAIITKKLLEKNGKTVLLVNFADLLKFYAKQYFGWSGVKDSAGRELLQKLGTDIVRNKFPDFWVESVYRLTELFKNEFDYFLIGDCRFKNECNYFKDKGYDVVNIKVIRLNFENSLTPEQKMHPSETALNDFKFDYIIESESGLDNLEIEVQKIIGRL